MNGFAVAAAAAAALLACAYRERGQGHSWLGTTGARVLFWALPVGAAVYAIPPSAPEGIGIWTAVLAGAMAYLGLLLPHGAGQNLRFGRLQRHAARSLVGRPPGGLRQLVEPPRHRRDRPLPKGLGGAPRLLA